MDYCVGGGRRGGGAKGMLPPPPLSNCWVLRYSVTCKFLYMRVKVPFMLTYEPHRGKVTFEKLEGLKLVYLTV